MSSAHVRYRGRIRGRFVTSTATVSPGISGGDSPTGPLVLSSSSRATTARRQGAFGASTPWYKSKLIRGRGTNDTGPTSRRLVQGQTVEEGSHAFRIPLAPRGYRPYFVFFFLFIFLQNCFFLCLTLCVAHR